MSVLRQHRSRRCSAALHPPLRSGAFLSRPKVRPVDGDLRGVARACRSVVSRSDKGAKIYLGISLQLIRAICAICGSLIARH